MRIINNIYINFRAFAHKNQFVFYKHIILAVFLLVLILLSNISLNQNSQGLESRLINENNIEESTMESIPEVLPEIPEQTIDQ